MKWSVKYKLFKNFNVNVDADADADAGSNAKALTGLNPGVLKIKLIQISICFHPSEYLYIKTCS